MISPVIVDARHGTVTAHCESWACVTRGAELFHRLYTGGNIRAAEQAADAHLKEIRDGGRTP